MLQASKVSLGRGERTLIQDVSLTLMKGEVLYVHGPNGSGKTTLLRALAGLTLPERGTIDWRGLDVRHDGGVYRRDMLFLGHLTGLKRRLTPLENLNHQSRVRPKGATPISDALRVMGVSDVADLQCGVLSAGQRRRVALARLLCEFAELWILDEPFTSLDAAATGRLSRLMEGHVRTGGLLILTSHSPIRLDVPTLHHLELPHA